MPPRNGRTDYPAASGARPARRRAARALAGGTTRSLGHSQYALGIDVSQYQTEVDWQQVSDAGIAFAYIKASEGVAITDPLFAGHWQSARSAGLLRGAYHWFRPSVDALAQAQHFVALVGRGQSDLPPALDLEAETLDGVPVVTAANTAAHLEDVRTWLVAVEAALGLRPVIYTSPGFWEQVVSHLGDTPDWLRRYPLWVAAWIYRYTEGRQPLMPSDWNHWTFWQFGSPDDPRSVGWDVPGIPGGVDADAFQGTVAQLRAWTGTGAGEGEGEGKTRFTGSNQNVIDVFFLAFGVQDYWSKLVAAGLDGLVNARTAPYVGPTVEDLPNLSDADRAALRRVLVPG
jgi:GH25 family lysozyme M1 (1,4-beta-N-acetylmuramidase)